ncbi:uncharacterized protein LOC129718053 [Wyeomyia smithii]|uniref:uncharacterized protein LOC129718053 n=1 Tax=Wyeomyia smithii TaxID=174621 RepID=UPI00246816DA|nr:uncharacterized protein LOC129718053 [Wyeomyia smithii]
MHRKNENLYNVEYLTEYSPEHDFQDQSMNDDFMNTQPHSNTDGSITLKDNIADTFYAEDDCFNSSGCDDSRADVNTEPVDKKKFCFLANYYVKQYTRQKNGLCINKKTNVPEKVDGGCVSEILQCIWIFIKPHLCREIDVSEADGIKVSWSVKEEPDIRNINKFVYLRNGKRKTVIKLDQLGEGNIMLKWRDKVINIFAFAYSQSVSSVAIWEAVNKCLLQPNEMDRAGAPSNVILEELVQDLKEKNTHLQS